MSGQYSRYPVAGGSGVQSYPNFASLPPSAADGTLATTIDTHSVYIYNAGAAQWQLEATATETVTAVGTIDSQPKSANGAVISGNAIVLQTADATDPGLMSTGTQTIAGNKTFTGSISASNLSGTNTGDVTLTAVGSSPNADGASLSGQALTLQPADGTHPGLVSATTQTIGGNKTLTGTISASNLSGTNTGDVTIGTSNGLSLVGQALSLGTSSASTTGALTSTDWSTFNSKQSALTLGNLTDTGTDGITVTGGTGAVVGSGTSIAQHIADSTHNGYLSSTDWSTFNSKQAAGNYVTSLTGDVTASGPGAAAATLATVNSNVGSFTYSSITVNAKGLITAASSGTAPLINPMTTGGDMIVGGSAGAAQRLANGSAGQYLQSAGGTTVPAWTSFKAPTIQTFTGSTTYTKPTSPAPLYIVVEAVGGGGGGTGSGTGAGAGSSGGTTSFGTAVSCTGGVNGGFGNDGGAGGTGTLTGISGLTATGNSGAPGAGNSAGVSGGNGGASYLGGAGSGGFVTLAGMAAATNSGSGGGGAGGAGTAIVAGSGGGGGGYAKGLITSISSTYTVTIGSGGGGGSAGTSGSAGGNGAAGYIIVWEYYQ